MLSLYKDSFPFSFLMYTLCFQFHLVEFCGYFIPTYKYSWALFLDMGKLLVYGLIFQGQFSASATWWVSHIECCQGHQLLVCFWNLLVKKQWQSPQFSFNYIIFISFLSTSRLNQYKSNLETKLNNPSHPSPERFCSNLSLHLLLYFLPLSPSMLHYR